MIIPESPPASKGSMRVMRVNAVGAVGAVVSVRLGPYRTTITRALATDRPARASTK